MMERLVLTIIVVIQLIQNCWVFGTPSPADIINTGNLKGLKDDTIIEVLSQNKTVNNADNYTVSQIIEHFGNQSNDTKDFDHHILRINETADNDQHSNSYYGKFR